MNDFESSLGLDVHKNTIAVAIADAGRGSEIRSYGSIPNTTEAIDKLTKTLATRRAEYV